MRFARTAPPATLAVDAFFGGASLNMVGNGNYAMSSTWNDKFSSIRSNHSGSATYRDSSGSTNAVCLANNFEVSNLSGTSLNDKISYVQVSGFGC